MFAIVLLPLLAFGDDHNILFEPLVTHSSNDNDMRTGQRTRDIERGRVRERDNFKAQLRRNAKGSLSLLPASCPYLPQSSSPLLSVSLPHAPILHLILPLSISSSTQPLTDGSRSPSRLIRTILSKRPMLARRSKCSCSSRELPISMRPTRFQHAHAPVCACAPQCAALRPPPLSPSFSGHTPTCPAASLPPVKSAPPAPPGRRHQPDGGRAKRAPRYRQAFARWGRRRRRDVAGSPPPPPPPAARASGRRLAGSLGAAPCRE